MSETILNSPVKFLGGYVLSFNSSLGFNSSPSTCNITLLSKATEAEFDIDNPANAVGTFHVINLGDFSDETDFSFAGIITSIVEKTRNIDGITYSIQLSDPRIVMAGIHLILTPNPGISTADNRVIDIYNRINNDVGNNESISSYEKGGTNAIHILQVLGLNTGDIPLINTEPYPAPQSSILYTMWGTQYSFGFVGGGLINPDFKITGETITLADLFQQLGDGNAFDWYVTGPEHDSGINQISIQTISRQTENTDLSLNAFIDLLEVDPNHLASEVTTGTELRKDATGAIVYSDREEFLDEILKTGSIDTDHFPLAIPDFSGDEFFTTETDIIQPHRVNIAIDDETFEPIPDDAAVASGYLPTDDEMRAALAGFDNWVLYISYVRNHPIKNDPLFYTGRAGYSISEKDIIEDFWTTGAKKFSGPTKISDLQHLVYDSAEYAFVRKIKNAYDLVSKTAQELYGRVFVFPERKDADVVSAASTRTVKISSYNGGSGTIRKHLRGFTYNLIGDGRKAYEITQIVDSAGASTEVDTFFDDGNGNGRTTAYVCFADISEEDVRDGRIMVTESPDNVFFQNGNLYIKASITNGLCKISPVFDVENTPCVIDDKIAIAVFAAFGLDPADCAAFNTNIELDPDFEHPTDQAFLCKEINENNDTRFRMSAKALVPDIIYIPYKHKQDVWNIYQSSSFGTGPIVTEKDESLSPANYSNFFAMDVAGLAKVERMSSPIQEMETGNIVAVGLPIRQLGSPVGINSNITNVSVSFGISGVTTTYNLESFIKRYGKLDKQQIDGYARAVNEIKTLFAENNESTLQISKEKIAVIGDIRQHVGVRNHELLSDAANAFGCNKEVNFQIDKNDANNSPVSKGKGAIIARRVGFDKNPNLKTNLFNVSLETSVGTVPAANWRSSYGVDLGMLFTGFRMGDHLDDGGPETFGDTGEPSAGDLNPYKLVTKDGQNIAPFKQVIDGNKPTADTGFDINEIRGIAFRLPMMLAGWGYTTDGDATFQSESDKLDYTKMVVAPLDVRYDADRQVWAASGGGGGTVVWLEYDPLP